MDFRQRLSALNLAVGRATASVAAPDATLDAACASAAATRAADAPSHEPPQAPRETVEQLRERIARLQARSVVPTESPRDDAALIDAIDGTALSPGVVIARRTLPLAHAHGRVSFEALKAAPLALLDIAPATPLEGLVFLDTETSGLSGGSGTVPFLVGIARIRGDSIEVAQYFLTRFGAEADMLAALAREIDDARYLVTFNGKCFDVPLLAARYRLARLPDPLAGRGHVDLLHPTRRAFARYWTDCRLQTAERELFGLVRHDDIAGADIPAVWFDFMRSGRLGRLADVVSHNRLDILSLAALLPLLAETSAAPGRHGSDVLALARGFKKRGERERCLGALEAQRQCLDDGGLLELAHLKRALGAWDEASAIWSDLSRRGDARATEALAKYYEHVTGDIAAAVSCTETLLRGAPAAESHARRLARLQRKASRGR